MIPFKDIHDEIKYNFIIKEKVLLIEIKNYFNDLQTSVEYYNYDVSQVISLL